MTKVLICVIMVLQNTIEEKGGWLGPAKKKKIKTEKDRSTCRPQKNKRTRRKERAGIVSGRQKQRKSQVGSRPIPPLKTGQSTACVQSVLANPWCTQGISGNAPCARHSRLISVRTIMVDDVERLWLCRALPQQIRFSVTDTAPRAAGKPLREGENS